MELINIQYVFKWENGEENIYDVNLDAESLDIIESRPDEIPSWAKLEYHQCPHCILDQETTHYCPLALHLVQINRLFSHLFSYEKVEVEVITRERTFYKKTTAQQAISSLIGIIIPCSGCPQTCYFKPMAHFHLPFASEKETVYRVVSMYLLAQYFFNKQGEDLDLELNGLYQISRQLNEVNNYCAKRLRNASTKDSTINAVILLDIYAHTLNYVIRDSLDELQHLFCPYFK